MYKYNLYQNISIIFKTIKAGVVLTEEKVKNQWYMAVNFDHKEY